MAEKSSSIGLAGDINANQVEFYEQLNQMKSWFHRMGSANRRRFMMGLTQRLDQMDVMKYFVHVLNRALSKDYTYTRSRTKPSLPTDSAAALSDHALDAGYIDEKIKHTLDWFEKSSSSTKTNFLLAVLCQCDVQLLHSIVHLTKTMLAAEWANQKAKEIFVETAPSTRFSDQNKDGATNILSLRSPRSKNPARPISANPATIYSDTSWHAASVPEQETDHFGAAKSVDSTFMVHPSSAKAYAGAWDTCDFIRELPIHLSKYIMSLLDTNSLITCQSVSRYWQLLATQVLQDYDVVNRVQDDSLLMQGGAAEGVSPTYASDTDVPVPVIDAQTLEVKLSSTGNNNRLFFQKAYLGQLTRNVIMEERNMFCGAYNVMMVMDKEDGHRVIHTDGRNLVTGSNDRKIRLIDKTTGVSHGPVMSGHAGSIKCLHLCSEAGYVLSGSYDTTIRHWNTTTGTCLRLFQGHQGTVTALAVHGNLLASGARDKTCKVWEVTSGQQLRSFHHHQPVTAVAINETFCVSADESGVVKVWSHESAKLIKVLRGHSACVTALKFDRWHLVTCSNDSCALLWSMQGKHKKCLISFRHQKPVLCVELIYLRVITGSEDGRIRIWNALTGHCCRIMRGNSRSDPVLALIVKDNQITVNTRVSVITLNFEDVEWDYCQVGTTAAHTFNYPHYSDAPVKWQPHSYVRAKRMRIAGTSAAHLSTCPPAHLSTSVSGQKRVKSASSSAVGGNSATLTRRLLHSASSRGAVTSAITSMLDTDPIDQLMIKRPQSGVQSSEAQPDANSHAEKKGHQIHRRMSYTYERTPPASASELIRVKAVWRAQIRTPGILYDRQNVENIIYSTKRERPRSSPSRIDSRVRVPISDVMINLGASRDCKNAAPLIPMTPPNPVTPQTPLPDSGSAAVSSGGNRPAPKTAEFFQSTRRSVATKPRPTSQATTRPKPTVDKSSTLRPEPTLYPDSPYRDPLRLMQTLHLKTYAQERQYSTFSDR